MAAKLTPDLKNIDGDVHFLKGTKWLPNGGTLPQWLSVDLGESLPVTKVVSSPEFKHVAYGYKIEVSEYGKNWSLFADRSANRSELPGDGYIDESKATARSFSEIQTTFEYPTLSYKYLIETSEDGSSWKIHSDKRAEFPVAVNAHRDAGQSRARFVRITLVACQRPENSGGIYGFRVLQ